MFEEQLFESANFSIVNRLFIDLILFKSYRSTTLTSVCLNDYVIDINVMLFKKLLIDLFSFITS